MPEGDWPFYEHLRDARREALFRSLRRDRRALHANQVADAITSSLYLEGGLSSDERTVLNESVRFCRERSGAELGVAQFALGFLEGRSPAVPSSASMGDPAQGTAPHLSALMLALDAVPPWFRDGRSGLDQVCRMSCRDMIEGRLGQGFTWLVSLRLLTRDSAQVRASHLRYLEQATRRLAFEAEEGDPYLGHLSWMTTHAAGPRESPLVV